MLVTVYKQHPPPVMSTTLCHYAHLAASKCTTYLTLFSGSLQDTFLDAPLADQPIHCNLLGLAQPVSAVHGLLIHRWVPVAVIEDDLRTRNRWKQSTTVLWSMTTRNRNNTNDHALSGWPSKVTKFLTWQPKLKHSVRYCPTKCDTA